MYFAPASFADNGGWSSTPTVAIPSNAHLEAFVMAPKCLRTR